MALSGDAILRIMDQCHDTGYVIYRNLNQLFLDGLPTFVAG
jgi:hypothetical protein